MLYDFDYFSQDYYGQSFRAVGDIEGNYASITEAMIALFIEQRQEVEEA